MSEQPPYATIPMPTKDAPPPPPVASPLQIPRQPSDVPPTQHRRKQWWPAEKLVIGSLSFLSALTLIGLSIGTIHSFRLVDNPEGPLAAVVVITFLNIVIAIWLLSIFKRPTGRGGLLPLFFLILAGALLIAYYAKNEAESGFADVFGLLSASTAISGVAAGAILSYLAFAHN